MVLASEYLAGLATLLAVTTANSRLVNKLLARRRRTSESISAFFSSALLVSYAAVRLLAESESPQSVMPIYMAVVLLLFSSLSTGKYYYLEWLCKGSTVLINSATIAIFLLFKGLDSISVNARANPLDQELQWYHVVLVHFASYRWFLVNTFVSYCSLGTASRTTGCVMVVVRGGMLWVLTKATGKSVASRPWGMFDEILLNDTALLNVVLSVLTFTLIMDQITAMVALEEMREMSKKITWDEFEYEIFKKWPGEALEETGNEQEIQGPEGSQTPETSEAEGESVGESSGNSGTNVDGQGNRQIV